MDELTFLGTDTMGLPMARSLLAAGWDLRVCNRTAKLALEAGVTFVDAPVLGTKAPAEHGQLVILASGPESAQSDCEPICSSPRSRVARSISLTPAPRDRR